LLAASEQFEREDASHWRRVGVPVSDNFAWLVVLVAFFILAVQLFITLIEFKLTTLAGFVLVPFGLFNKTAFLAERVLGNVIASGVKVLVLAVIVGIGTTLFSQFTQGFGGNQPTLDDAMALVLAALALLGLGIFGPGIATGLTAGGTAARGRCGRRHRACRRRPRGSRRHGHAGRRRCCRRSDSRHGVVTGR
jgi:P-type conjugative transfer protein TrbL